jgi:hypothetical protein
VAAGRPYGRSSDTMTWREMEVSRRDDEAHVETVKAAGDAVGARFASKKRMYAIFGESKHE